MFDGAEEPAAFLSPKVDFVVKSDVFFYRRCQRFVRLL